MKRNKIEEVDVNAKEKRQFKCDRCGMLCTYDKDYPYNLCYKCNQNLEDEIFSVKLKRIKRLKNIIRKQNRAIEQLKPFKKLYYSEKFIEKLLCAELDEKDKEIKQIYDLLDKHDITGIEALRHFLEDDIQKLKLFWVKDYAKVVKAEYDTLKSAYELACAFLAGITQDNVCDYKDFFYQEAEKNGRQRRKER